MKDGLEEAQGSYRAAMQQTLGGAAAPLLLCLLALLVSLAGIGRPIQIIAELVRRLAVSDLGATW